jgi:hypothetical protein
VCTAPAEEVTGKWVFEQPGRGARNPAGLTLNLKQEGKKLTGTVTLQGQDNPTKTEIKEGKVEDKTVFFKVVNSSRGNSVITEYKGTISGDQLKLQIKTESPKGSVTQNVVAQKCPPNCSSSVF